MRHTVCQGGPSDCGYEGVLRNGVAAAAKRRQQEAKRGVIQRINARPLQKGHALRFAELEAACGRIQNIQRPVRLRLKS